MEFSLDGRFFFFGLASGWDTMGFVLKFTIEHSLLHWHCQRWRSFWEGIFLWLLFSLAREGFGRCFGFELVMDYMDRLISTFRVRSSCSIRLCILLLFPHRSNWFTVCPLDSRSYLVTFLLPAHPHTDSPYEIQVISVRVLVLNSTKYGA